MTPTIRVLEEVGRVAPLGVRFWDVAAASIATGLRVSAYPEGVPELRRPGVEGKTGVYSFRALPLLGDLEVGSGDDAYWLANAGRGRFTVEVTDPAGRYLPWQWTANLPHRGLLGIAASPLGLNLVPDATWIPLFSAPARAFDAAMGVVRAALTDPLGGTPAQDPPPPAAWALLEVRNGSNDPVYGLADERGAAAAPIPYPAPPSSGVGSPLAGDRIPLSQQTWPVQIRVFYGALGATRIPELVDVLQQPLASAWQNQAMTTPFAGAELRFGRETVLRTRNGSVERADLFVTLAGSPI